MAGRRTTVNFAAANGKKMAVKVDCNTRWFLFTIKGRPGTKMLDDKAWTPAEFVKMPVSTIQGILSSGTPAERQKLIGWAIKNYDYLGDESKDFSWFKETYGPEIN